MTAAGTMLDVAPRASRRDLAIIATSVALHVGLAIAVGRVPSSNDAPAPGPTQVTLEVAPPPPAEAPPKPETPPPAHERRVAVRAARRAAPASQPAAAPPSPAAAEPVDLTGVTLTDPNGAAWAAAAGNGESRSAPVGPVGRRPSQAPQKAATGTGESDVVPLADLRQPPQPPALQAALEQQYPADARRDGTVGQAQVRARVRSDGNLDRIRVVVASAPSFGDACRRVLAGSRWSPPLGRDGEPCATEIRYVCRFEITR